MGFIGILIVVAIIYYFKKKKEERERANEFQIQPELNETVGESDVEVSNPFVSSEASTELDNLESTNQGNPFISEKVVNEEGSFNTTKPANPFIQNEEEEIYYEEEEYYADDEEGGNYADSYVFPECSVNDKNFSKSHRNIVGKFLYEKENYIAISYDWNGENYLLFQRIIDNNGAKKHQLIDYGFLWLKLLKTYIKTQSVLPYQLEKYGNLSEMPNVPDEQLEDLYEIEKDVKSIYNDVQQVPLTFSDGTEKVFWKFGDVIFGNNEYHFLMSQTNPDDTMVFKVTSNGESRSYDEVTNPSTLDMIIKVFHKKYGN